MELKKEKSIANKISHRSGRSGCHAVRTRAALISVGDTRRAIDRIL
jgi:hypothetical protein